MASADSSQSVFVTMIMTPNPGQLEEVSFTPSIFNDCLPTN